MVSWRANSAPPPLGLKIEFVVQVRGELPLSCHPDQFFLNLIKHILPWSTLTQFDISYQTLINPNSTWYIWPNPNPSFLNLIYPTQPWYILTELYILYTTLTHPYSTWYIWPNPDPSFLNFICTTQPWSILTQP